jgi:hypothetical protein
MRSLANRLMFCEPFINMKFEDYIKEKNLVMVGEEHYKTYKFLKDLDVTQLNSFNLFLDVFSKDLRSRNKSSGITNHIERKEFFESHKVYHLHFIDENIYETTHNKKNELVVNKNEDGTLRTIETVFTDFCHLSDMYINYQRKEIDNEIFYKILFICAHPAKNTNQWNELKANMEILKN